MPNRYLLTLADGSTLQLELDEALDWTVASNLNDVDDGVSVLTTSRELVPFAVLRDYIVTQVTELGAQISEQITLPDVIAPTPQGTYAPGTLYNPGDIVELTLADGRTGSWMCKVTGTTESPFGSEDWQIISLPATSGQNNSGYTSFSTASVTGDLNLDLALERRFVVSKTANKTLGFIGLNALGNAVVALKSPLTGTVGTISWPSYVWWEETGPGTAPVPTNTPGRGDVILFTCWDTVHVIGKVVEKNVLFEASPVFTPGTLTDQKLLYLFKNNSTLLQNSLAPGTDDFSGNTGTPRNPYGIDFISGQDIYNAAALTSISFAADKPWTMGFVFQGLLNHINGQTANNLLSFFGLASLTNSGKYIRPEFFKTTGGALWARLTLRDNATDIAGGVDAYLRLNQGVTSFDANTLSMITIEYDAAGQFQMRHINTDERLYDTVAGAYATNLYPSKSSARILNYAEGLAVSVATTKRVGGKFYSTDAKVRYGFGFQKVLTQAERKTLWGNSKTYIANTDPTGPQLPTLGY